MKIYLNWQGETIDELSFSDFETQAEFLAEQSRLLSEYAKAGKAGARWQKRACKGWN